MLADKSAQLYIIYVHSHIRKSWLYVLYEKKGQWSVMGHKHTGRCAMMRPRPIVYNVLSIPNQGILKTVILKP